MPPFASLGYNISNCILVVLNRSVSKRKKDIVFGRFFSSNKVCIIFPLINFGKYFSLIKNPLRTFKTSDWVFSTWRSHYHALLKEVPTDWIEDEILKGKSITLCNIDEKFYSSAIVGGTLSIALGVAMGIKQKGSDEKVFVFVGDMSFESGIFYEVHKYARNFDLPIIFVVEDNAVSTYTPTEATWNTKREIPSDVIHYTYKSKYPHYGSGKWVVF